MVLLDGIYGIGKNYSFSFQMMLYNYTLLSFLLILNEAKVVLMLNVLSLN